MTRPLGEGPYDDKVRARLAEIMAAAGNKHAEISLEVMFFLPRDFIQAYERLFDTALKADNGEDGKARGQTAGADLGKAKVTKNGAGPTVGGGAPKRYKKAWFIQDTRALNAKTRIDKRLRMIAREIEEELTFIGADPVKGQDQCGKCKLFLQVAWRFCPQCGHDREIALD